MVQVKISSKLINPFASEVQFLSNKKREQANLTVLGWRSTTYWLKGYPIYRHQRH